MPSDGTIVARVFPVGSRSGIFCSWHSLPSQIPEVLAGQGECDQWVGLGSTRGLLVGLTVTESRNTSGSVSALLEM